MMDAVALKSAIAARQVSCVEVMTAYRLEGIEASERDLLHGAALTAAAV